MDEVYGSRVRSIVGEDEFEATKASAGLNKVEGEKPEPPFPAWIHKMIRTKAYKKYEASKETYDACVSRCANIGLKDVIHQQKTVASFEEQRRELQGEYRQLRTGKAVGSDLAESLSGFTSLDDDEEYRADDTITHGHDGYRAVAERDGFAVEQDDSRVRREARVEAGSPEREPEPDRKRRLK